MKTSTPFITTITLVLLACSSNKSNQELIIGTWTSCPIITAEDFSKARFHTYNKDSTFYAFFGDYDSNGRYYIYENYLYTTYGHGDTDRAKIIEVNDSILRLEHEVNDFESIEYRLVLR